MRNTIQIAILLMLVPKMASAQFYTITKETEIKLIQASDKEKSIDNKKDTTPIGSNNEPKDTLKVQPDIRTSKRPYTQKVDGKTSQKSEQVKSNGHLPELTIPNLYTEIKRNGILYPKVVLAQAILKTGWFTSPLCRDRHNLFGLTNPHTGKYYEFDHCRKVSEPTIPRCSTSTNEKMGTICFGWKRLDMRKHPIMFRLLSVC